VLKTDRIRRSSVTFAHDIQQLSQRLQEARLELMKSLKSRDQAHIEPAGDEMDQVQAAEARELAARTLDRWAHGLREIDDALYRLKDGEYGICANCGEEIGFKRLRAIPWALFCLACQEIVDDAGQTATQHSAVEALSSAT
jgi:RNA polymerase-binding protein DksA